MILQEGVRNRVGAHEGIHTDVLDLVPHQMQHGASATLTWISGAMSETVGRIWM